METLVPEARGKFGLKARPTRNVNGSNMFRLAVGVPEGEIEFETPLDSLQKLNASSPLEWLTQSLPRERLVEEGEEGSANDVFWFC